MRQAILLVAVKRSRGDRLGGTTQEAVPRRPNVVDQLAQHLAAVHREMAVIAAAIITSLRATHRRPGPGGIAVPTLPPNGTERVSHQVQVCLEKRPHHLTHPLSPAGVAVTVPPRRRLVVVERHRGGRRIHPRVVKRAADEA